MLSSGELRQLVLDVRISHLQKRCWNEASRARKSPEADSNGRTLPLRAREDVDHAPLRSGKASPPVEWTSLGAALRGFKFVGERERMLAC